MSSRFPVVLPLELGFRRSVVLAAQIVDGVTFSAVTRGIKVSATGLTRPPIINAGGFYVWLEEGDSQAQEIVVESLQTVYQDAQAPPLALPAYRRIELSPAAGYRFPAGATALRGTLRESLYGSPAPVGGALVRLQWSDDRGWHDAPLASRSAANGDFAAGLRLASNAEARTRSDGNLTVRLAVGREGFMRFTEEVPLRQGAVSTWSRPFVWDELRP